MIPDIFRNLPVQQYVDGDTPIGCILIVTTVVGISTTYIIRAGRVLGRIECHDGRLRGYLGDRLKGGYYLGTGSMAELGQRIVTKFEEELRES